MVDDDQNEVMFKWLDKHWFIFINALLLPVNLLGIITSILIMYVILRFSKLRICTNYYIFHVLLCNIIYCVFQSLTSAYCIYFHTDHVIADITEVVWNFNEAIFLLVFVYTLALVLDWYVKAHNKESLARYQQKYYKIVLCLLYLLAILKICLCFVANIGISRTVLITCAVAFLIVTVCNWWRCCGNKGEQPAYRLQVASVIVYSYVPFLLYFLFCYWELDRGLAVFISITSFLPSLVISCIPVTLYFVLRRRNSLFREAFDIALHGTSDEHENSQLYLREEEKV